MISVSDELKDIIEQAKEKEGHTTIDSLLRVWKVESDAYRSTKKNRGIWGGSTHLRENLLLMGMACPEELKARVDKYNMNHPFTKISISRIAQKAVNETLNEVERK